MREYSEAQIERAAEQAHEANRAYCILTGDNSQPRWADAPEWAQDSARNGVKFVIANWGATPADQHANWVEQKAAEGWTWDPSSAPKRRNIPVFACTTNCPASSRSRTTFSVQWFGGS